MHISDCHLKVNECKAMHTCLLAVALLAVCCSDNPHACRSAMVTTISFLCRAVDSCLLAAALLTACCSDKLHANTSAISIVAAIIVNYMLPSEVL